MNKQEFLFELKNELSHLSSDDVEERLDFYSEMINDLIDEGLSEEEAVKQIGPVEEIVSQTISDTAFVKIIREKLKPDRTFKKWEILLLILGSPLWFSLLIAVLAVFFSLYVTIWALIISLWAVEISFIVCSIGCIISGLILTFGYQILNGLAALGAGMVLIGLSIFLFFGCKGACKSILIITKKSSLYIKKHFIKKGKA